MAEFRLSEGDRGEVQAAARQAAGVPLTEVTPESFPLPTAGGLLSRTAYEDYPEPERRRDLIRLWLNV